MQAAGAAAKAWTHLKHLPLAELTVRMQALVAALPAVVAGQVEASSLEARQAEIVRLIAVGLAQHLLR